MGIQPYVPDTCMSVRLGMEELLNLRRRAQAGHSNPAETKYALFDIIMTVAAWEIGTALSYGQIHDAQAILAELDAALPPCKQAGETAKAKTINAKE